MPLENIANQLPEYAKDLKLNLSSLFRQTELSEEQIWAITLSSALACKNRTVIQDVLSEASEKLSPEMLTAAKAAAAIMAMNNIYYRFGHLVSNEKYLQLPSKLRMNIIRSHGASEELFELCSTAVSAINGCGLCVDSHEKKLRESGVSEETILAAVRIASVINGVSSVLATELQ